MGPDVSPGGSFLLRHRPRATGFEDTGTGDADRIEAIEEHIGRWVGPVESVFHELVSDMIHLDIAVVPATAERPFQTLVTVGMTERPMTLPQQAREAGVPDRAELVLLAPPAWDFGPFGGERFWPVGFMKHVARLPHEHQTWLGPWHTVPNGDPARPFANDTRLAGVMLAPPVRLPEEFTSLERHDGERIAFLAVVFLTADELDLKLQHGTDALLAALDANGMSDLLVPDRPGVVDVGQRPQAGAPPSVLPRAGRHA